MVEFDKNRLYKNISRQISDIIKYNHIKLHILSDLFIRL